MNRPGHTLQTIQKEYFAVLEASPLISKCEYLGEGKLRIPGEFFDTRRQLLVMTRRGYRPTAIVHLESLLKSLKEFWGRHETTVESELKAFEGHAIHTPFRNVKSILRRYGCFFDCVLIADQLMITGQEIYSSPEEITDWPSLITSIINTAFVFINNKDVFLPQNRTPYAFIVPPRRTLNRRVAASQNEASVALGISFHSEMLGQSFKGADELYEYLWREPKCLASCDQRLLQILFRKHEAKTFERIHSRYPPQCTKRTGNGMA